MVNFIKTVFASPDCPEFLAAISEEMKKSLNFAFESETSILQLEEGYRTLVSEQNKVNPSFPIVFRHSVNEQGGSFGFYKGDASDECLLSMTYSPILGHVVVSMDKTHLYKMEFFKENEEGGSSHV